MGRPDPDGTSTLVAGHLIHIFRNGDWEVWVNCEDQNFSGLCVGTGSTRDEAVAEAVTALEAIVELLQRPFSEARS